MSDPTAQEYRDAEAVMYAYLKQMERSIAGSDTRSVTRTELTAWSLLLAHAATLHATLEESEAAYRDLKAMADELSNADVDAAKLEEANELLTEENDQLRAEVATLRAKVDDYENRDVGFGPTVRALQAELTALREARTDNILEREGERIAERVSKALHRFGGDPNDGDVDSGDHADFIVSAIEACLSRWQERLELAVSTIRQWHGMGMPENAEREAWALYQESPEMRAINVVPATGRARGEERTCFHCSGSGKVVGYAGGRVPCGLCKGTGIALPPASTPAKDKE